MTEGRAIRPGRVETQDGIAFRVRTVVEVGGPGRDQGAPRVEPEATIERLLAGGRSPRAAGRDRPVGAAAGGRE